MKYEEYGGFAYQNGVWARHRSDAILTTDGHIVSNPGSNPLYMVSDTGLIYGREPYHVMIGEWYLLFGINRNHVDVFYDNKEYSLADICRKLAPEYVLNYRLNGDLLAEIPLDITLTLKAIGESWRVQYALLPFAATLRLTSQSGEWMGWVAYKAGEGFDTDSTRYVDQRVKEFWNDFGRNGEGNIGREYQDDEKAVSPVLEGAHATDGHQAQAPDHAAR